MDNGQPFLNKVPELMRLLYIVCESYMRDGVCKPRPAWEVC